MAASVLTFLTSFLLWIFWKKLGGNLKSFRLKSAINFRNLTFYLNTFPAWLYSQSFKGNREKAVVLLEKREHPKKTLCYQNKDLWNTFSNVIAPSLDVRFPFFVISTANAFGLPCLHNEEHSLPNTGSMFFSGLRVGDVNDVNELADRLLTNVLFDCCLRTNESWSRLFLCLGLKNN